jgi:hypothetical protein
MGAQPIVQLVCQRGGAERFLDESLAGVLHARADLPAAHPQHHEVGDQHAKQAASNYRKAVALARTQFQGAERSLRRPRRGALQPGHPPADFLTVAQTAAAPNTFFPLVSGTTFNYRAVTPEGTETIEFTVTRDTRKILGVTTIVVHDIVKLNGSVIEDTLDWFAQDRSGNVWCFGENVADYEDAAEVIAVNQRVTVPFGTYAGCLNTEDFTPIDPESSELKFYAPGIGNVRTINPDTGKRTELISIRKK